MNPIITFPNPDEYPEGMKNYIEVAKAEDLLSGMAASQEYIINFMLGLEQDKLLHRYAPGKWSIKELLVHMMDAERIFAYRALRFARQDKTNLAGFEENDYVGPSKADNRTITSILSEYAAVRQATIELFKNFDDEMLNQVGTANNKRVSVRALGYAILGHEIHHLNIIRQRYLEQV